MIDKSFKKNVYLGQIISTNNLDIVYLPYSVGCLAAYAWQDELVKAHYKEPNFLFKREKIEEVLEKLEEPAVLALSSSVWNFEYNKALAKAVKERFPSCLVTFGGHHLPLGDSLLKTEDYIDVLAFGEGEEAFLNVLKALVVRSDFAHIKGIVYRGANGKLISTPEADLLDLTDYPSPYLNGMFDPLVDNNPQMGFCTVLETNRGCPYDCSFCDWCKSKQIRLFSMEKVAAELEWIAGKKIEFCYVTDANFGIVKRDTEVAKLAVKTKENFGYPKIFSPTYAKTNFDTVFEAAEILFKAGMNRGVTVAYQSLSSVVLKNIGRENMTLEVFSGLKERFVKAGIPIYTELILGLPGESYESFLEGIEELLEAGQHHSMPIYMCQVFPQAPMGKREYLDKHKIKTVVAPIHEMHYYADFSGVQEYYDLVLETDTMPFSEWVQANLFSTCLKSFHHFGLLRCFAIYLNKEKGLSYLNFYKELFEFVFKKASVVGKVLHGIKERLEDLEKSDWTYKNPKFGENGWYFDEGLFLEMIDKYDLFWEDILPFIKRFDIDEDIYDDLLAYQKAIIRRPGVSLVEIELSYDFKDFFDKVYLGQYTSLKKEKNIVKINPKPVYDSFVEYAKHIAWYGMHRGASVATSDPSAVSVEYL